MNTFAIHPGTPRTCDSIGEVVEDLGEAVEESFPLECADATLCWNGVSVDLSYKYDLSVIVEDILELVGACSRSRALVVRFGSNTFNAEWDVRCQDEMVAIHAHWHAVSGNKEAQLNAAPVVVVPIQHFLRQWIDLLRVMLQGVSRAGVSIRDESLLRATQELTGLADRSNS